MAVSIRWEWREMVQRWDAEYVNQEIVMQQPNPNLGLCDYETKDAAIDALDRALHRYGSSMEDYVLLEIFSRG